MFARCGSDTQVFTPVTTISSPRTSPAVAADARSEPCSGSEKPRQ